MLADHDQKHLKETSSEKVANFRAKDQIIAFFLDNDFFEEEYYFKWQYFMIFYLLESLKR